ncbi:MAG: hypothetical protein Kow00127_16450 [Bacteroidales bacterium]
MAVDYFTQTDPPVSVIIDPPPKGGSDSQVTAKNLFVIPDRFSFNFYPVGL